ncbi:hypothetical protein RYA05_04015 [Pseudomonas syringae pv. actinidiae]|nr:hypothetical protein [Pseudomonas syringae pv. actinidiae]
MEIIIVGADSSTAQAVMAALVQAGITAKVTEVESINVAVNVSGGNVQEVVANAPVTVEVVDYDNNPRGEDGYQDWDKVKERLPLVVG